MTVKTPAQLRAQRFMQVVPAHLRHDALVASVHQQLLNGGVFSQASHEFIKGYLLTAKAPMTPDEFERAMTKALS